ncbi:MAG: C-type lectin domain-containing protein, partial [Polyangiaceae bacterium]
MSRGPASGPSEPCSPGAAGSNRTVVGAVLVAWAAAGLVAFACIPDLPIGAVVSDASVDREAGFDAGADVDAGPPPAPPRCGDGIIQLDRGEQCDPGTAPSAVCTPPGASPDSSPGCQMVCPDAGGFVWPGNNHCYSYDGTLAADLDTTAADHCANAASGTHVVTFASEQEYQAVVAALQPGAFWVGFDPVAGIPDEYTPLAVYEPGWAPTCPGCFAHTEDPTAPLPGATASCVEALADAGASWQQYPCSAAPKIGVLCEREPLGLETQKCDGGVCIDVPFTHAEKRYVYLATRMGGNAAETQCEALGGTLVVLESRDEREQLWFALYRMGGTPGSFWIGLSQQN